jgi:NAD(P)-dependent dehydrogenase (short-subunit alcohol dehydrogenase family)
MPTIGDMTGRAVLVTGAASGLGRATALKLGQAGARLCIVDHAVDGLEQTAALLREQGAEALVHAADLTDPDRCAGAVAAARDRLGRLDALCNVAGVIIMANTPEMAVADWSRTLAVNLSAPFHLIQAAIPHLLDTEGAVVNVASTAAFIGEAYAAAYCASKAGLVNLTRALAMEYVHKPIRFNAVAPGGMATGMMAAFRLPEGADMALIHRFSGMRGLVEVDDVADMIAFLASPAASGYHGACISIDKGITAG